MHSVCSFSSAVRILNQTHRVKWMSGQHSNIRRNPEVLKASSRIICTDPRLQGAALSHKFQSEQDTRSEQETLCLPVLFLKDNLKIVDSRYLKLVTISNECQNIDEFLRTKEFKVLSRSSFFYDVNLAHNLQRYPSSSIYCYSLEDIHHCGANYAKSKQISNELHEVFISNSSDMKENETGKPSEQQLLSIIDKLTQCLLNFFEKPHDYAIYHKNIIFQNNIKGVTIKGLNAYMQAMTLLKLYGYVQYAKVKVEILKITHHMEDGSIRVRWRVNGISRHRVLLNLWKLKDMSWKQFIKEEAKWLDGFSVFMVGPDGLIHKHICDKMTPDDHTLASKPVDLKSKILGLLEIGPRGPATGSLHTLIPCYRFQDSCKKIT